MKKTDIFSDIKWKKRGLIIKPENVSKWWKSHAMAPAPVLLNDETIRIFVGGLMVWQR